MMKTFLNAVAVALVAAAVAIPATAKNKTTKNEEPAAHSERLQEDKQTREPGEAGTFQGKPVVQGPADWSSVHAGGAPASSGASTGEAGSGGHDRN